MKAARHKRHGSIKKKWMLLYGFCLALICIGGIIVFGFQREIVLRFGMFTGSNWDVASADSFEIIDRTIRKFEKEHPGVRIEYASGISKEDYSEWLAGKLLDNQMPDVFMIKNSDFNKFCSLGAVEKLDEWIENDVHFNRNRFFPSAFRVGQANGHAYALPYEIVPTLLFVNKSLLLKEGIAMPAEDWTWNDMYNICQRITKDTNGDGILDQFGTYNYHWLHAIHSNGDNLMDEETDKMDFTSDSIKESLSFTKKIYDLNEGQKVTQEDFNNGKVAFMPLTFAEYRTYKTYPYKIKKYSAFQWDCTTFPAGNSGGNTSEVDALLIGISSKSRRKALAWEFLKTLTYDEEIQMDIFRYSQGVSVLKRVTKSEEAQDILKANMEAGEQAVSMDILSYVIENGITAPKGKQYDQVLNLADIEINKILEEEKDIDSTMKIFQRKIRSDGTNDTMEGEKS